MGAHDFSQSVIGKNTPQEAYRQAVDDALYEEGHSPYNGTISTTRGFRLLTDHPRPGTKAFYKWEEERLNELEKWSHCYAIEIKGAALKRWKERCGYKGKRGIRGFYFFGWAAS